MESDIPECPAESSWRLDLYKISHYARSTCQKQKLLTLPAYTSRLPDHDGDGRGTPV
jgi:hypothetical protein